MKQFGVITWLLIIWLTVRLFGMGFWVCAEPTVIRTNTLLWTNLVYTNNYRITNTLAITREQCEANGGHCFVNHYVLTVSPNPPRRIKCKHCGHETMEKLQ